MLLKIEDKGKQEIFTAVFQILKQWSGHITMCYTSASLVIQVMDKSHVCLAHIEIPKQWFSYYECDESTDISVNSTDLCTLMSYSLKHDIIEFVFKGTEGDKLNINFLNNSTTTAINNVEPATSTSKNKNKMGSSFNHYFEVSLIDVVEDKLGVPDADYDVEITIEAKRWAEVLAELSAFGENLDISCNENEIQLATVGHATSLQINIPIDKVDEYAISEGAQIKLSYSLNHIFKMCSSTKLSAKMNILFSEGLPMTVQYDLGDSAKVRFFVAPKIVD
jgi:DNA polymerase III sliding clamp (beta) subunit (PCNA family)